MERPSETCRVLFQNKVNLRYCASGWFYYRNRKTVHFLFMYETGLRKFVNVVSFSVLLAQYCSGDKIEKNEMDRACSAYGG